jgi:hypothetical protein
MVAMRADAGYATRVCKVCGEEKATEGPERGFHLNNGKPRAVCASCMNRINGAYREEHPEQEKERVRRWRARDDAAVAVGEQRAKGTRMATHRGVRADGWTQEEEAIVLASFRTQGADALQHAWMRLPGRTMNAVRTHARMMGLQPAPAPARGGDTSMLDPDAPVRRRYRHDPAYGDPLAEVHELFRPLVGRFKVSD